MLVINEVIYYYIECFFSSINFNQLLNCLYYKMSEQIVFIGLMAWDHIGKGFSSIKKGEDIDGIIIEKLEE